MIGLIKLKESKNQALHLLMQNRNRVAFLKMKRIK